MFYKKGMRVRLNHSKEYYIFLKKIDKETILVKKPSNKNPQKVPLNRLQSIKIGNRYKFIEDVKKETKPSFWSRLFRRNKK